MAINWAADKRVRFSNNLGSVSTVRACRSTTQ